MKKHASPSNEQPATPPFAIVGIGATGSVTAVEQFLQNLPAHAGLAIVLVMHLPAYRKRQLVKTLQASTQLPVVEAVAGLPVQPNQVYVAPVGHLLTIEHDVLQLPAPAAKDKRRPIDFFFQALAADQGVDANAVILSGTGTDGVQGIRAVKAAGGFTLAQTPESAVDAALPRRIVATNLIDGTGTPGELAQLLSQRKGSVGTGEAKTANDEEELLLTEANQIMFNGILAQLHMQTGHDLSHYKRSTILRRIARRLQVNNITSLAEYLAYLHHQPGETQQLFKDCLISVTNFFRDPPAFEALAKDVLAPLLATKKHTDTVRIWVAGCATGEEAYSLALLLYEQATQMTEAPLLQIFATDIDEDALSFARRGLYPRTIATDITPGRLQRFFVEEREGYRIRSELREIVLFAVHNLLKDPPFSKLDLICCRNLLIYFNREAQEKTFDLFHYALNGAPALPGYLFLGTSESTDAAPNLFAVIDKRQHLFQRRETPPAPRRLAAPTFAVGNVKVPNQIARPIKKMPSLEELYQQWTLRRYAPPRVLVNENYDVTHIFNGADRYLREREGAVTQNILHKVLPELRLDLRAALYQAWNKGERTDSRLLRVAVNHESCLIQLHVGPIEEPGFPKDYVEVVFEERQEAAEVGLPTTENPQASAAQSLTNRLEEELLRTRERLQSIIEDHEISNHELKVANEELQSINEELKSTSEELETSKEELQSMNEELITVNQELKQKIDELGRANSDLLNLITATDVGTVFLDQALHIKRFTPRATDLFHFLETDIGRPLTHIAHRIRLDAHWTHLVELSKHVLSTLEASEEIVQSEEDRWYILRIFPYRTLANTSDGVVITFVDITELKQAESEIQQRIQQQMVAELGRQALQGDDTNTLLEKAMQRVAEVLGVEFAKVLESQPDGQTLRFKAGVGWSEMDIAETSALTEGNTQSWYTFQADKPVVVNNIYDEEKRFQLSPRLSAHKVVSGVTVAIPGREGLYGVLGVYSTQPRTFTTYDLDFLQTVANVLGDAIERERTEAQLAQERARLEAVLQYMPAGVMIAEAPSGKLLLGNQQVERIFRHPFLPARAVAEYGQYKGFHPDGRPYAAQEWPLARAITTGEVVYNEEIAFLGGDGVRGFIRVSAAPIHDEAGRITTGVVIFDDITERKQMEEALRRQAYMLENTHDAIFLWALDGALEYWNQGAERLYGYTKAEALGQVTHVLLRTVHPCPLERIEAALQATGEWTGEVRHTTKAGRVVTVLSRHQLLKEPDGRQYVLETSIDITDRKQIEEALQASAANFRAAIEHASDAIFIANHNRAYVEVNAAACTLSGYSREELLGKQIEDLTPLQAQPRLDEDRRHLLAGRSQVNEWSLLRKDGSTVPIEVSAKQLPDGRWQAIVRDITERKAAEELIRSYAQRFRQLSDAIPQIVWIDNHEGKTEYVNERWLTYTGFTAAASLDRGMRQAIHPDDLPFTLPLLDQAFQQGKPFEHELRLCNAQGAYRWHLCRSVPVYNENGQTVQWFGTATDIDERKRAEISQAFLAQLGAELRGLADPLAIITAITSAVGRHLQAWRCTFHEVEPETGQVIIHPEWRQDGAGTVAGVLPLANYSTPELRAFLQAGQNLVVVDVVGDNRTAALATGYQTLGIAAFVAVPYLSEQRWKAVLSLSSHTPRSWRADEVALLETIAARFWPLIERARAEQALHKNNLLLQGVINGTSDGIYVRDNAGVYLLVNTAGAAAVGMTPAQMIGKRYQTLFPAEEAAAIHEEDIPVLTTGELQRHETMSTVAGVARAFHSVRTAYRDAQGHIIGVINVVRDISERKLAEEALRASEERFATIFRRSPYPIAILSLKDRRYVSVNPTWEQDTGYTQAEAVGHTARELNLQPTPPLQLMHTLSAQQGLRDVEIRMTMRNGQPRTALVSAEQIQLNNEPHALLVFTDITARKQAEEALRESAEQLRLTTKAAHIGLWFWNLQTDSLVWTEQCKLIFGLQPDDKMSYPRFLEILHPEDRQRTAETIQNVLTNKIEYNIEYRVIWPDGSLHWVAAIGHGFYDEAGTAIRMLGVAFDITERKRAEEALRESEVRFRVMADTAPVLIWLSGPDGQRTFFNKPWLAFTGHALAHELHNGWTTGIHPNDMERFLQTYDTAFAVRQPFETEYRLQNAAGEYRWLVEKAVPRFEGDDQFIGYIGSCIDITERKQAEETIRQQLNEIEAIYAATPVGLCMVDANLRYVRINEALAQINGQPVADFIGRTLRETGTDASAKLVEPLYRHVLATGDPILNREIHGATAAEPMRERDWLVSYYPLANSAGTVIGVNAVVVEITERKQNERMLEQLVEERTEELTRRMRELDQFAYVASHDLKSPLRAIDNLSTWIMEDAANYLPADSKEHLSKLRGRVQRMEKLLDDLLAYSRADRYSYPVELVETAALVDDIVRLVAPPQGFAVRLPAPMPMLVTQRVPLEQVLRNLINNAIKHHHRPDGLVEVTAQDLGDFIEFAVTDNGPGIDPEFHERIFQIFQTLKPRDQVEGSGMGLAIVKKVVEGRGGLTQVESSPGHGATFRFTWPKAID